MKQVIVMRHDLTMRRGKWIAQGAHAAQLSTVAYLSDPRMKDWLENHRVTKVVVRCDSLDELLDIWVKAHAADLLTFLIVDAGKTEFKGVPTITCLAVGPDTDENLDPITRHLKAL